MATVNSDTLNFRSAPSANSKVITTLKKGDTLIVTGKSAEGWTPVDYEGENGYVGTQYITFE